MYDWSKAPFVQARHFSEITGREDCPIAASIPMRVPVIPAKAGIHFDFVVKGQQQRQNGSRLSPG